MKALLREMISASSGYVSSKRVCGVLGWVVILAMYVYCGVTTKPAPEFTDFLIGAIVTLLGVDSVTKIFKK